jgi:hypothetical protein
MSPIQCRLFFVKFDHSFGFMLVAAYQWAGRLGIFGEATTLAPAGNWQGHVWQGHVWNTVLAIILWLVWFYG